MCVLVPAIMRMRVTTRNQFTDYVVMFQGKYCSELHNFKTRESCFKYVIPATRVFSGFFVYRKDGL